MLSLLLYLLLSCLARVMLAAVSFILQAKVRYCRWSNYLLRVCRGISELAAVLTPFRPFLAVLLCFLKVKFDGLRGVRLIT